MALVGEAYEYYDKRFYDLTVPIAEVEELFDGCRWAEGPVWFNEHSTLVWSDIPANVQYRWLEEDGHVSVFRQPANNSNGNTFDREGRQISFEHLTRRVVRYERNGTVTVLAERYEDQASERAPNHLIILSGLGIVGCWGSACALPYAFRLQLTAGG